MKHVQHVRGKYVARMTVPEELRQIIGKRELVEPLGGDKKQAERKALAVLNGFHAILDDAREILAASRPTLSTAAKDHYRREMLADDLGRNVRKSADADFYRQSRAVYAHRLRLMIAGQVSPDEAEALIGYGADHLAAQGLAPDVSRQDLLRGLAEVQLDALTHFDERDQGQMKLSEPTSPLLTAPDPQPVAMQPGDRGTGTTLTDVVKAFHKERSAGRRSIAVKTMEEHHTAVRMFEEFIGDAIPVASITKKDVIAYKQSLLETPARRHTRFPGLTLPQAIKANQKRPDPYETLDPKTINGKWLSHLNTILQWAANNGHIEHNPASGVRVDTGRVTHQEPKRLPFDQSDLNQIFGTSLFTDPAKYETRQWALLVALHSGARSSSEFARIKLSDIREDQGVSVFDLNEASKNAHSKRIIPIHKDLLALGILDYAQRLRDTGETRLFPDWNGDNVNRWFLRSYLPSLGIKHPKKVFHSFRHTLLTELERTGCDDPTSKMIAGHGGSGAHAGYVHDAPIKRMKAALDRVDFNLPVHKEN